MRLLPLPALLRLLGARAWCCRTGGIGYREVKALVADVIDARVAPRRERYERLLADPAEIDARLAAGEQHACQLADQTLARTMAAMGL